MLKCSMLSMPIPILPPREHTRAPSRFTNAWRAIASVLVAGLLTILSAGPAPAGTEFAQASVSKGVLLVASPSLDDPNFQQTVVLIVEHGAEGTLGIVLNRSTDVLLSEALPDLAVLKGTTYRLFAGGPVAPARMLMLFRIKTPPAEARLVFDEVYVGGTPAILERIITQAKPAEAFRVFAGVAGWAPGQLQYELRQRAWAILPPDATGIFDKDPDTLWLDCIRRLQVPGVISN
jgi:putative transcriptional regulator